MTPQTKIRILQWTIAADLLVLAVALLQLVGFDPGRASAVAHRPLPDVRPSVGKNAETDG